MADNKPADKHDQWWGCGECGHDNAPWNTVCKNCGVESALQKEVEDKDATIATLRSQAEAKDATIRELEKKVAEYEQLFDLQHTRTEEAEGHWCIAHGERVGSVKPDLGKLVEWLLTSKDKALLEVAELKSVVARLEKELKEVREGR